MDIQTLKKQDRYYPCQSVLTGDLYEKHEQASMLASQDESWEWERDLLEEHIPHQIPLDSIDFGLESPWLDTSIIQDWIKDRWGLVIEVLRDNEALVVDVNVSTSAIPILTERDMNELLRENPAEERRLSQLEYFNHETVWLLSDKKRQCGLRYLMEGRAISIVTNSPAGEKVTSPYLNDLLQMRVNEIQADFRNYVINRPDAWELGESYNRRFNSYVAPNWDGAAELGDDYESFKSALRSIGVNPAWVEKLRRYQMDAIWRFSQQGGLLAFEPGLGKTVTGLIVAMLRKHWGLCHKPLFVVQKSTLQQFGATAKELFPGKRILIADKNETCPQQRQKFLSKLMVGAYDLTIMTHQGFESIPLGNEAIKRRLLAARKDEEENQERMNRRTKSGSSIMKAIEGRLTRINSELSALDREKQGFVWGDLGIDYLVYDECQRLKSGIPECRVNIKGVSVGTSKAHMDCLGKLDEMRSRLGDECFLFMTGTPEPTNSMTGMYSMLKFLEPSALKKWGCTRFDAWLTMFGRPTSEWEPHMAGGYRQVTRLNEFKNLPELWQVWLSRVHRKNVDDVLDELDVFPKLRHHQISCPLDAGQREILAEAQQRYANIRNKKPRYWLHTDKAGVIQAVDKEGKLHPVMHPFTGSPLKTEPEIQFYNQDAIPERIVPNAGFLHVTQKESSVRFCVLVTDEQGIIDFRATEVLTESFQKAGLKPKVARDNNLAIYTMIRQASVAPQLVNPQSPVSATGKIASVAATVADIYRKTRPQRSTQLIFCDLGTPGGASEFSVYDAIAERLVQQGIPRNEIAYIQDHKTDAKRKKLFAKMNAGDIAVLIGSTEPLGIGVDVQKRGIAMHMVDVPFRPDQYRQRLGRFWRSGNTSPEVHCYQYLSEGSNGNFGADTMLFNLLKFKAGMQEQLWQCDGNRTYTEDDESSALYMLMMAESTGDESFLEFAKTSTLLDKEMTKLYGLRMEFSTLSAPKERKGSCSYFQKELDWWTNHKKSRHERVARPILDTSWNEGIVRLELAECHYPAKSVKVAQKLFWAQCLEFDRENPSKKAMEYLRDVIQGRLAALEKHEPWNESGMSLGQLIGSDGVVKLVLSSRRKNVAVEPTRKLLIQVGETSSGVEIRKTPELQYRNIIQGLVDLVEDRVSSGKIESYTKRYNAGLEKLERLPQLIGETEEEVKRLQILKSELQPEGEA